MNFVLSLETDTFIDLVHKAIEQNIEDRLWQKWLHDGMKELSFDEYKEKHTSKPKDKKSDEEIIQDAESILKSMSRK
jgi:hypothetical protein